MTLPSEASPPDELASLKQVIQGLYIPEYAYAKIQVGDIINTMDIIDTYSLANIQPQMKKALGLPL